MRLLIVGCEYAGKTTLARAISHRLLAAAAAPAEGAVPAGPRPIQWHNHFVVPAARRSPDRAGRRRPDSHRERGRRSEHGRGRSADYGAAPLGAGAVATAQHLAPPSPGPVPRRRHVLYQSLLRRRRLRAPLYYGYGRPGTFSDRSARGTRLGHRAVRARPGHRACAGTRHRGGDQGAAAAGCAGSERSSGKRTSRTYWTASTTSTRGH